MVFFSFSKPLFGKNSLPMLQNQGFTLTIPYEILTKRKYSKFQHCVMCNVYGCLVHYYHNTRKGNLVATRVADYEFISSQFFWWPLLSSSSCIIAKALIQLLCYNMYTSTNAQRTKISKSSLQKLSGIFYYKVLTRRKS